MSFKMKVSGVPAGSYRAKFTRWEESTHAEFGDRVLFEFTIVGGSHDGAKPTRYCSAKLSPKTALAKIAAGLAGKKLEINDEFDPDAFIGTEYLIVIEETDSGATRVGTILPAE